MKNNPTEQFRVETIDRLGMATESIDRALAVKDEWEARGRKVRIVRTEIDKDGISHDKSVFYETNKMAP